MESRGWWIFRGAATSKAGNFVLLAIREVLAVVTGD